MKDKRTARKKDKSAIPPGGPGSPLASPSFIPEPANEQEPKYRMWTLIQAYMPPPPPPTGDANTECVVEIEEEMTDLLSYTNASDVLHLALK
jgi:hypothetical protein